MCSIEKLIILLEIMAIIIAVKSVHGRHNRFPLKKKQIVLFPDEDLPVHEYPNEMSIGNTAINANVNVNEKEEDDNIDYADNVIDPFPGGENHNNFLKNETLIRCMQSGNTFCENEYPVEYNIDYIEKSLTKAVKTKSIFLNVDEQHLMENINKLSTGRRSGHFDESISFCETKRTIIYPRWGLDIHGDWRSILNQDQYRQPVKVLLCVPFDNDKNGKNVVFKMTDIGEAVELPSGYRTRCIQAYQEYELLSVNKGEIEKKFFKMPSNCVFEAVRQFWWKKNKEQNNIL